MTLNSGSPTSRLLAQTFDIYRGLHQAWRNYFKSFNFCEATTVEQFDRQLEDKLRVDSREKGFEDFAGGANAPFISPGNPCGSVFFHALASPAVVLRDLPTDAYPSESDLETVENFIYARAKRTLSDIRQIAGGAPLAIVAFAKQYRVALETTHGRHADFVFARTGVSRVGNEGPDSAENTLAGLKYDGVRRCFSCVGSTEGQIPVLPCRYSTYIAAKKKGSANDFIPGRFSALDDTRDFWLPVHKLFDGDECLQDVPGIHVLLSHFHMNEKLRRIHGALHVLGRPSRYGEPEISKAPFVDTDLITEFARHADGGSALVIPKTGITDPVMRDDLPVTVTVFPSVENTDASLRLFPRPLRWAPEFVNARTRVDGSGLTDLNQLLDVAGAVSKGEYEALHYKDYTGDGWVRAICRNLAREISISIPAYSIIAPPDLMPNLRQSELADWFHDEAPLDIRQNLWNGSSPIPLSDQRLAANIRLPGVDFQPDDTTGLALVGLLREFSPTTVKAHPALVQLRTTTLPDASSGIFAPGSDIGSDQSPARVDEVGNDIPIREFMSNYGMGSPFLEDTKLCAAQSSFWPGTTPDTARVYEHFSSQPTVTPLLDSELAWDGSQLPVVVQRPSAAAPGEVRHQSRAHTDYRTQFAGANFSILHSLGAKEYIHRTITMSRVYQALGSPLANARPRWVVLNFQRVAEDILIRDAPPARDLYAPDRLGGPDKVNSSVVHKAMTDFGASSYRFIVYRPVGQRPEKPGKFLVSFFDEVTIYANPTDVYVKRDNFWEHHHF